MVANLPEVAGLRYRGAVPVGFRDFVVGVRLRAVQLANQKIDLWQFKSRERDVEVEIERQLLEFQRKQLRVPAGVLRKLVVRDHVGANLGRREVADPHRRDVGHSKAYGGERGAVTGDDPVLSVQQDWPDEPEFPDTPPELLDLLLEWVRGLVARGFRDFGSL